ncbi:SPOR domain-containing protein [Haematomicrobium sanguinis]|uniref:SPOR domain-containing protein n=1 Tax=Haematomicrobium sanguinis TaxID=479106 RepID=UPI000AB22A11|nr:SPOR domain-containing protein [Haematomicrobium sanguinis]
MAEEFWYNMITKKVEVGAQSDWSQLLGPYETREEAEHAPEKVRENTERWDKEDEADS